MFQKVAILKIYYNIGPFLVKTMETKSIVEILLNDIKFRHGEKISYDPHHLISKKNRQNKSVEYEHQWKPLLENISS